MGITINNKNVKNITLGGKQVKYVTLAGQIIWSIPITADINLMYSNQQLAEKLGSFQWKKNNDAWSASVADEWFPESEGRVHYKDTLHLKNITVKPGFRLNSITYNGTPVRSNNGIYSAVMEDLSVSLNINYINGRAISSASLLQFETYSKNSLVKEGFNVTWTMDGAKVAKCSQGTVIATIPIDYRPSTNKSFTIKGYWANGQTQNMTYTINASTGQILAPSNIQGSGSQGGKGGSASWHYPFNFTINWSTK